MSRLLMPGLFAMLLLLESCASPAVQIFPGSKRAVLDRLYCGRSMPEGGVVSEEAWKMFLSDVVVPRFPGGFTTWRAEGGWSDSTGMMVREDTFILELVHDGGPDGGDRAVDTIINEYRSRFRQQSVMWVREEIQVRF